MIDSGKTLRVIVDYVFRDNGCYPVYKDLPEKDFDDGQYYVTLGLARVVHRDEMDPCHSDKEMGYRENLYNNDAIDYSDEYTVARCRVAYERWILGM